MIVGEIGDGIDNESSLCVFPANCPSRNRLSSPSSNGCCQRDNDASHTATIASNRFHRHQSPWNELKHLWVLIWSINFNDHQNIKTAPTALKSFFCFLIRSFASSTIFFCNLCSAYFECVVLLNWIWYLAAQGCGRMESMHESAAEKICWGPINY